VQTISRKGPKSISQKNAYYLVGFVDGEGSFNISFKVRKDYRSGIQVYPSFNISQKEKDILVWIKNQFSCGTIRNRGDGVYYYEVVRLDDLRDVILPFFETHKLKTRKKKAFRVFSKVVQLLSSKKLEWEDIEYIFHLREEIVVGRKRKYSLRDIKGFWKSPETIRQNPQSNRKWG
jgi:hypothetical protein